MAVPLDNVPVPSVVTPSLKVTVPVGVPLLELTVAVTSPASGTPTGSVTFKDGSSTLATVAMTSGIAGFQTSTLSGGSHSITAVYGGDTNYSGSTSSPVTQVVQSPIMVVTPASNMVVIKSPGGPFSPASFQYNLSVTEGTVNYSISGLPAWITASATSGALLPEPTTVTFTVNPSVNTIVVGTYTFTVSFTNLTSGVGNQTRTIILSVNNAGRPARRR